MLIYRVLRARSINMRRGFDSQQASFLYTKLEFNSSNGRLGTQARPKFSHCRKYQLHYNDTTYSVATPRFAFMCTHLPCSLRKDETSWSG